jgi:large conductance mechanosensitive channel
MWPNNVCKRGLYEGFGNAFLEAVYFKKPIYCGLLAEKEPCHPSHCSVREIRYYFERGCIILVESICLVYTEVVMFAEFREFVKRGSVVDMAVGIIIGTAFGSIAQSLVADIIMPPLGLLISNVDFTDLFIVLKQGAPTGPYLSLERAAAAGAVTINYGKFVNTIVRFVILAFVIFIFVRKVNRIRRKEEAVSVPETRECPYCLSNIPLHASKCPFCTAYVDQG